MSSFTLAMIVYALSSVKALLAKKRRMLLHPTRQSDYGIEHLIITNNITKNSISQNHSDNGFDMRQLGLGQNFASRGIIVRQCSHFFSVIHPSALCALRLSIS